MKNDVVILVSHVSKDFVLPHLRANSIKSLFTGLMRRPKEQKKENQRALKDINFEINRGEFFGIVGRNGSGKSTLLKIIAGIYQPTQGDVAVRGKLVPFIELGVGFNPELTGRENVFLNGAMLGFSRKEISAMYDDIVSFAELERFMDQRLKNYSSGMQVRLAFSMAIRAEADVLLIDEVLAVGDADFQRKCFEYFKQLKKNQKTVVFVSHDMDAVREYCDRAILVERSRIVRFGSAEEIAIRYARMFVKGSSTNSESSEESKERWGSGDVKYSLVNVIANEKAVTISGKVKVNKAVENMNLGFSISDGSGKKLLGTNSVTKRQNIANASKGQSISFTWQLDNILNDGGYVVNVAAVSVSGEVWDWWDSAVNFRVTKDERPPYVVNPSITLTKEIT